MAVSSTQRRRAEEFNELEACQPEATSASVAISVFTMRRSDADRVPPQWRNDGKQLSAEFSFDRFEIDPDAVSQVDGVPE